jgi:tetratricopeptide (TPR) repeat protein
LENKKKLDSAESLLQIQPDSSLSILESIASNDILTREAKARYALLMTAALNKNYIVISSDSLIKVAVDYYSARTDQRRRMMANYYQGLVLNNSGEYTAAIVALEKAEKDALNLGDHLYSGLIYRNKGDIFNKTNNDQAVLSCFLEAIRHFKELDNPDYAEFAELSLAVCYINSKDYDAAKIILQNILNNTNNDLLKDYCSLKMAIVMLATDANPMEVVSMFQESPTNLFGVHEYGYYATALDKIGQYDSVDLRIADAYSLCVDNADSAMVDFIKADLLHRHGNDAEAYKLTRNAAFVQDSVTRLLLQQSVSNAQRDYYKAESQLQEERARRLRERNRLGTLTVLLSLALLSGLTLSYRKRKEQVIQEQILKFSITQSELHRAEQTNASLLGSLFSEKFNHLDKLSADYVRAGNDRERLIALREFKEEIAAIRTNDDLFLSLEKDLDRYCDGVMTKLKNQVPAIKGDNRKLISLFFAGLPYSTVQLVMNRVSIESLKTARSRFRKEIKAVNAPDEELFLRLLEMKNSH